ncbi:hypothetical protein PFWH6_4315 [Pseudomonas fluorescens WH6]|nr:hypothetical protein PFWH6_4315 [Pseudomonas fluorescens WH6]
MKAPLCSALGIGLLIPLKMLVSRLRVPYLDRIKAEKAGIRHF